MVESHCYDTRGCCVGGVHDEGPSVTGTERDLRRSRSGCVPGQVESIPVSEVRPNLHPRAIT